MQNLNKKIFKAIIALVLLIPVGTKAQTLTSSINTYSPYSMYGLGELATPGTVATRSMGGVGVAMWSYNIVNLLNPAAYAATPRQSFLFNFGVEGAHYRNYQDKYSGSAVTKAKTAYNSVNVHDIAFQMPLAKGLAMGFSLTPYSNVGYTMYRDDVSPEIAGNLGRVRYQYNGEGDVTEVKLGAGWSPSKRFAIGAAAMYYWGGIERNYKSVPADVVTGSGEFSTTTGLDTYDVSRVKAQFGVIVNPIFSSQRILSIGATYDIGGSLKPDMVRYVYVDNLLTSVVREEIDNSLPLKLPKQIAAGIFYQDQKYRAGVDYVYQSWGSDNVDFLESYGQGVRVGYADVNTVKVGFEIIPKYSDVRRYLNRVAYRVGARYGGYYQTFADSEVRQLALTAGVGLPVKLFGRSSIDIGFEYGTRMAQKDQILVNNTKVGTVRQEHFKFSIGMTMFGEDRWFYRFKFD